MTERADDTVEQAVAAEVDTGATEPDVARLTYHGSMGSLALLTLSNLLLTFVTVGTYRFWARTRFRDYFWRNIEFLGDRFEYTGKGLELFFGFLIALVVIIPLALTPTAIETFVLLPHGPLYAAPLYVAFFVLVYFLIGFATFRARRYRLSRTAWRGIRCGQTGSAVKYAVKWLLYSLLSMATLGLAAPLATVRLQQYAMGNTWLGDKQVETSYSAKGLFKKWFWYWLFLIPTLGLTYVWYSAAKFRYLSDRTRLDQLRFSSNLAGKSLFVICLAYGFSLVLAFSAFVTIISFVLFPVISQMVDAGAIDQAAVREQVLREIMSPTITAVFVGTGLTWYVFVSLAAMLFFTQPLLRVMSQSIEVTVRQDFSTLQQSTQKGPGRGEGLADSFDLSGF